MVGNTIRVANHFNFKHQNKSLINQQVKWDFCKDNPEKGFFIAIPLQKILRVYCFCQS
jgi:hypothetical protein